MWWGGLAAIGCTCACLALPAVADAVVVQPPNLEEQLGHPKELPPPNTPSPTTGTSATPTPEPAPESPAPKEPAPCLVPALKGLTLHAATVKLLAAHCKLGHVTKPHRRTNHLVVVSQSARPGAQLATGATVAIRLGRPPHRR